MSDLQTFYGYVKDQYPLSTGTSSLRFFHLTIPMEILNSNFECHVVSFPAQEGLLIYVDFFHLLPRNRREHPFFQDLVLQLLHNNRSKTSPFRYSEHQMSYMFLHKNISEKDFMLLLRKFRRGYRELENSINEILTGEQFKKTKEIKKLLKEMSSDKKRRSI